MTSNTQHGNHRKIIESFNKSEARNTNRLEIFQEIMVRKAKKSIAGKAQAPLNKDNLNRQKKVLISLIK